MIIFCDVENCTYNEYGKCGAGEIEIAGGECITFVSKKARSRKMAVLSNDELNVIRENAKCNVTDNDTWGNETVVSLINTIEAQQQEIEIQTINARTYLQEAENLQQEIKQKNKALKQAYSLLNYLKERGGTGYMVYKEIKKTMSELEKALNSTNQSVSREE